MDENVSEVQQREAELKMINKQTFDLVQIIQSNSASKMQKKQAFEEIQELNRNLDVKMEHFMQLKDKRAKKVLIQGVHECKQRTTHVFAILRDLNSLENLSNAVIAQLNDLAYKGVQRNSLQKMVDKRAVSNEELYQKLDRDVQNLVNKMDFKQIAAEHQVTIAEVGDCMLSCQNTVETMESQDCMGIGLSIQRPEAAIADPSRLQVTDIYPTYLSTDSFLESAKFKLMYN